MTMYLVKWGWTYSTLGPDDEHYEELWTDKGAAEARVRDLTDGSLTRRCGPRMPTDEELEDPAVADAMAHGAWGVSDMRPPGAEVVPLEPDAPATVSVEDRRRNK